LFIFLYLLILPHLFSLSFFVFLFSPSTSFLCFLFFVLLLPPRLSVPCATSNCFLIELLPHHLVLLPWFVASSHCLLQRVIALPNHCLVHYLITSSHYLATPPCCLVTLLHYLAWLTPTLSCYHYSLFHWFISLPCYLKVPLKPSPICCFVALLPCTLLPHCFIALCWLVYFSSVLFCKEELGEANFLATTKEGQYFFIFSFIFSFFN